MSSNCLYNFFFHSMFSGMHSWRKKAPEIASLMSVDPKFKIMKKSSKPEVEKLFTGNAFKLFIGWKLSTQKPAFFQTLQLLLSLLQRIFHLRVDNVINWNFVSDRRKYHRPRLSDQATVIQKRENYENYRINRWECLTASCAYVIPKNIQEEEDNLRESRWLSWRILQIIKKIKNSLNLNKFVF